MSISRIEYGTKECGSMFRKSSGEENNVKTSDGSS